MDEGNKSLLKTLIIYGTRPEAIKLAPVIRALYSKRDIFSPYVCVTGQHRQLLDQVNSFFGIRPDFDLNLMKPNQSLSSLTSDCIMALKVVLEEIRPDVVVVQGDTTTAFLGALAAFYEKKAVAHVEAGLRSNNKYAPYPEEINRCLVSRLADYHFAPTNEAVANLSKESIVKNVFLVGNTIVDALHLGLRILQSSKEDRYAERLRGVDFSKKIVLLTSHRRESFGEPFRNICAAARDIAQRFPSVEIVYPVHLNPNIREPVSEELSGIANVHLIEPVDYPSLLWLMSKSYLILTDSGGIQEEAPSLSKPVLVLRSTTERPEGVKAGVARLVGTDRERIVTEATDLLENPISYELMCGTVNPYGDGRTSERIVETLGTYLAS